jgi:hypothetical protein
VSGVEEAPRLVSRETQNSVVEVEGEGVRSRTGY